MRPHRLWVLLALLCVLVLGGGLGSGRALAAQRNVTTAFRSFKWRHPLALAVNHDLVNAHMARVKRIVESKHKVSLRVDGQQHLFNLTFNVTAYGDNAHAAVAEYEARIRE